MRQMIVNLKDGSRECWSQFKGAPSFEIWVSPFANDDGDILLVFDGDVLEGGYPLADVKSFWIYNEA